MNTQILETRLPLVVTTSSVFYITGEKPNGEQTGYTRYGWSATLFGRDVGFEIAVHKSEGAAIRAARRYVRDWAKQIRDRHAVGQIG